MLLAPDGDPVALNDSAAAVWRLIDRWRTLEELVVALIEDCDAPAEVLADDLGPLLRELIAAGLATDTP